MSVWTRPPRSSRLYAGTRNAPSATSGTIQSVVSSGDGEPDDAGCADGDDGKTDQRP